MEFVNKIDFQSRSFLKSNRAYLAHASRLFLVSTFCEDGIRMFRFNQYGQKGYWKYHIKVI